ncbi:MAG: SDR family NAD(P)-dependent oxidoreductase [Planctomycetota bacterium]|jgi:short-subunit dehydrogenase|nr:SDR family NAD(P)-dependent oxidoreductase [Planctomycetota bacterium]
MDPRGKNVWITGASSGIGRALAVSLAEAGARALVSARRADRLEETVAACRAKGAKADALPFDLADVTAVTGAAIQAARMLAGVDMLVCAGGVGMRGTALDTDSAVARRVFEVDFWGTVELARAVLPAMRARGSGQLVVVTGVLGKFGAPRRSFYSAAKHALHGWCDSLREELLGTGIEVTALVPGWVRTEISERALENDGMPHRKTDPGQRRGITPEECARRAMPAIVKGVPEQLIGGIECGSVYLNRIWPGLFRGMLRRRGIG